MRCRNYGIDFLRILAMFMIVVLHTLGQGGLLDSVNEFSGKYWIVWVLELACYCAVNCYALISGYVMHATAIKGSKILELWLQIVFYTMLITIIMFVIFPESQGWGNVINAIFPITRGQYWYLSAYFGMYIFIPLLNIVIEKAEQKVIKNVIIGTFLMMSVLATVLRTDAYYLNYGYSVFWLCYLYLTGAYIERYKVFENIKKERLLILYIAMVGITCISKAFPLLDMKYILGEPVGRGMLVSYTSPTIVLAGVFLFGFCSKLEFGQSTRKIIAFLAPASLGVYIIHAQPLIWEKLIAGFAAPFIFSNCLIMAGKVLVSAFLIWFACLIVDKLRIYLFQLIRIKNICQKIDEWGKKL